MNKRSKTDWEHLDSMTDEDIDTGEIAELDDDFFDKARLRKPEKGAVTLCLDADLSAWYRDHEQEYRVDINRILRDFKRAQEKSDA